MHATNGHGRHITTILLTACFMAVACGQGQTEKTSSTLSPTLASASEPRVIRCLGRLLPGERVIHIAAPAQSLVRELKVDRGDWVTKGQVLAVLHEHEQALAELHEAEAEEAVSESVLAQVKAGTNKSADLTMQKAVISRLEAEVKTAEIELQRQKNLYQSHAVARSALDDAELRADTAKQNMREAEARYRGLSEVRAVDIAVAQNQLLAARMRKERSAARAELTLVRAPIDSQVVDINSYPGEAVNAQGLLDLADTRNMNVEAEVHVSDVSRLKLGAPAEVSGDGLTSALRGQVTEILKQVATNSTYDPDPYSFFDNRIVKARIALDDGNRAASLVNNQVQVTIRVE